MVAKFLDLNNCSWQRRPFAFSNDGRKVWATILIQSQQSRTGVMHVIFIVFFLPAIFAGPRLVEIQDFLRSFLGRHFAGKLVVASKGRGGTPGNFWWGCTARFSKSWPYFRPKTSFFTTVFRPGLNPYPLLDLAFKKLCPHYLDWNSNRKDFLKSMSKSFISLSFLLIWNWNNKYVRTFP